MRITYLFISTLLLIANISFGESTANVAKVPKQSIYDLFDENSDGIGENHTKFVNLSNEAQHYILAHLNVTELLNVSMSYPKFSAIVNEAFTRRYSDYYIGVSLDNLTECETYQSDELYVISAAQKHIIIRDCKFAVEFLQHFKVKIFAIDQNSSAEKGHEYDPITLLYLRKFKNGDIEEWPFQEVEEFRWRVSQNVTNMQPLTELFPKLRKLFIAVSVELNNSFIEEHVPELDEVVVFYDVSNQNGAENQLSHLLRFNPQIRTFQLMVEGKASFPSDYAKEINKILPNLDNLTLWRFESDETIRFENVKQFSWLDRESHSLPKLFFPILETMDTYYIEKIADDMIAFFRNHENLKKLWFRMFDWNRKPTQHRLEEVLDELTNLVDFTTEDALSVDVILRIAKNTGKLEKFMFYIDHLDDSEVKQIRDHLENEAWKVGSSKMPHKRSENYLLAERKGLPSQADNVVVKLFKRCIKKI